AAVQVGGADLLQAGHVLQFDFAKAAEVDLRHLRDACAAGCCRRFAAILALLHHALDVGLHVLLEDATARAAALDLRQIDAELPGQLAYRRAGMDLLSASGRRAYRRRLDRKSVV